VKLVRECSDSAFIFRASKMSYKGLRLYFLL
jgi:hypothetical protein